MKLSVLVISIYFLFLALLPCNCSLHAMDDFLHDDSGQIVSVHIETDTLQETCTPFCVCSSYHDPNFIAKNELSLLVLDINLSTNPAVYNENHTTSYLQQLLRPPQG